jgi:PAS domain S-box-containing protein
MQLDRTNILKAKPLKEAKSKPIKHELLTDALFTSIGDGALTTDEFGRITRINPVALQILGYKESDIVGKPFITNVVAEDFEGHVVTVIDRPITRAYLTGKPISGKMCYRTKKGNSIPVSVNVSPIMLDGKPVGAIEVFRDVSVEIEVDRMKSEFISLASHQLRTPLSAIKTYTHMLNDGYMGELNDTQKKSLDTIIAASNRMNELISTLLNITRIESGTIAVNPKLLSMEATVNDVLPELNLMADAKAISLQVKVSGKLSTQVKTDSLIVKEVITNLVSNAIKYTPENGQVNIDIRPRRSDVLVEVSDTGWGIPEKAQDKVFSKFFRGQNIIKRETSGTGLGLYLVKGLLDTLHGNIWFDSKEGKGTSFYFTLPRSGRKNKSKPKQVKN